MSTQKLPLNQYVFIDESNLNYNVELKDADEVRRRINAVNSLQRHCTRYPRFVTRRFPWYDNQHPGLYRRHQVAARRQAAAQKKLIHFFDKIENRIL